MRRDACALGALASMVACAVGPNFERPPPPRVGRYTADGVHGTIAADGRAQVVRPGAQLAETWWQLFGSPPLDQLVRLALTNNQDLEVARANLRRSEWNLRAGIGVLFPQVDVSATASRQRISGFFLGGAAGALAPSTGAPSIPVPGVPPRIFTLYTPTGTISYTLDVFGGERRKVEALAAQVDLQCFSLAAAHLTVTGNVVTTAIAVAGFAEQIRVTEQLVAQLKDQVGLARVQAESGTVPYATVLSLQTQLANTAATLPPLRQQLAQSEALVSTLLGYSPAEWRPPRIALADFALPRELPVSLPAQLVRQRPDVLVAEATLHVSSANIGVATAAMFPTFTLKGSIGFEGTSLDNLFTHNNLIWSLAGSVLAPIFHGGTLNAQRRAAIEDYASSLAGYRQTVLNALHDVSNMLEAVVHDAEAVEATHHALDFATDARKLVFINYQNGIANYLDVIVANTQYQQALLSYVQAKVRRLQDTGALFIALGGGWWQRPPPGCG